MVQKSFYNDSLISWHNYIVRKHKDRKWVSGLSHESLTSPELLSEKNRGYNATKVWKRCSKYISLQWRFFCHMLFEWHITTKCKYEDRKSLDIRNRAFFSWVTQSFQWWKTAWYERLLIVLTKVKTSWLMILKVKRETYWITVETFP